LSFLMTAIVFITLLLELLTYRRAFFKNQGRIVDLILLLPLSIGSTSIGLHSLLQNSGNRLFSTGAYFGIILPLLLVLVIYRLHRVIGSRVLLADTSKGSSVGKIRAVDFIWTTPYSQDDDWIREELGPLANGKQLRLHRFLTRESAADVEGRNLAKGGLTTNYG